jgi:CheY-like chemotaxis protein
MAARILALLEHPETMKLIANSLEALGHIVFKTNNFADAMATLSQRDADLIVADVHLQDSHSIFDFMRWVKGDPHTQAIPFVCFSTEPVEVSIYIKDGVRTAARALGAAKYITMEKFDPVLFVEEIDRLLPRDTFGNDCAKPVNTNQDASQQMIAPENIVRGDQDAENKRVLERCLTNKARKVNLEDRIEIQTQRGELVRLRLNLEAEEWSPELEDALGDLRRKLGRALLELSKLHINNSTQQDQIALSRSLKDRVTQAVDLDEHELSSNERTQALSENMQSMEEQEIVEHVS